jgi:hypothetical protein
LLEYRQRIAPPLTVQRLGGAAVLVNLIIGAHAAGVFGLLFSSGDCRKAFAGSVALAFTASCVIILFAERWYQRRRATPRRR